MTGPGELRVLWVTDESPDRSRGGGSIRQSHLLERLAGVAAVDLLLAGTDPSVDAAVAAQVDPVLVRLTHTLGRGRGLPTRLRVLLVALSPLGPPERYDHAEARRVLARRLRALLAATAYDVVLVEHLGLAPLMRLAPAQRWVLDVQRVPSRDVAQQLAQSPRGRKRWLARVELAASRRLERSAMGAASAVLCVSREDADALGRCDALVPNGVDLTHWTGLRPLPAAPAVVFTGSFDYGPNVDGALWFCGEVWPLVRQLVPGATLSLVGRRPTAQVAALAGRDGVFVNADVPDVRPFIEAARVAVVPLRFGSGTRLKALEAAAAGRVLVGTTVGLEGLGLTDGVDALVADDTAGLATAVQRALVDDGLAGRLTAAAGAVARRHDWAVSGDALEAAVRAVHAVASCPT